MLQLWTSLSVHILSIIPKDCARATTLTPYPATQERDSSSTGTPLLSFINSTGVLDDQEWYLALKYGIETLIALKFCIIGTVT